MSGKNIEVVIVPFGSLLYERAKVCREEVLLGPLGLRFSPQDIEGEESQTHIAAVDRQSTVVGAVILKPLSEYCVKLRQMAVARKEQGIGLGRKLVSFAEKTAEQRGFKEIELDARIPALGFYEKLGYAPEGSPFFQYTPLITMRKTLVER
jgi:GNAT superfamily N-acetyltransferase